MAEQPDLNKSYQADQKEIKAPRWVLRRKVRALAEGIAVGAKASALVNLMGVGLTRL